MPQIEHKRKLLAYQLPLNSNINSA